MSNEMFFCIGMQKAGTTWLYENLKSHSSYFPAKIKEPHFYDLHIFDSPEWRQPENLRINIALKQARIKDDILDRVDYACRNIPSGISAEDQLRYIADICRLNDNIYSMDWYKSIFANKNGLLSGDFTADTYLADSATISRISADWRGSKFILLLRDPIERDWAQLRMLSADTSLLNCLSLLESRVMADRNRYDVIIDRWCSNVSSNQLKFLFFEDIKTRPIELLEEVCEFLGLQSRGVEWENCKDKVHEGRPGVMPPAVREVLASRNESAYRYLSAKFPSRFGSV